MCTALLASVRTLYPADVLLFHPAEKGVFLVGTYLLDEVTRKRHGKICVYTTTPRAISTDSPLSITLLTETECDAVLDMKWYQDQLYVAHSTGSLSIYHYDRTDGTLSTVQHRVILEAQVLIMSLSVSVKGVMTSHSDGTMGIWTHDLAEISSWQASALEVWIQAQSRDPHVVFSGSDDGLFAAWDTRASDSGPVVSCFANRKSHGAGVTAILPYGDEHQVLTGSYDDSIRRFDLRRPQRAIDEARLGGGVWRIVPRGPGELLTCCMYDGAKIIDDQSFDVVKEFQQHESIVYGGDVMDGLVGTCSFYDKSVHIWH